MPTFQTDTRGTATVNRVFDSYGPYIRGMERKPRAAMVSMAAGQITAYALDSLQSRGRLFVAPGAANRWSLVVGCCWAFPF
jgi:GTP-binding protein